MTLSVIVVTLSRPECVKRCLNCLFGQSPLPDQIIVVDASTDGHTETVVAGFPAAIYLKGQHGYGHMTASRNLGLKYATGDIIAFIDDDAYVHPGWLVNLVSTYSDASVGAVGGRALNAQPGEETLGIDQVGQLTPDGILNGYFAANPGRTIEVNHIVGCNMSCRRDILAELGGLREDYTGTEVREETDMCLRVQALGYKVLFNPLACVDHIGAPQVKGRRFDARYSYYAQRNHLVLLIHNFGPGAAVVRRYLTISSFHAVIEFIKRIASAAVRFSAFVGGTAVGGATGVTLFLKSGRDPIRHDAEAKSIRAALQPTAQEVTEHAFR